MEALLNEPPRMDGGLDRGLAGHLALLAALALGPAAVGLLLAPGLSALPPSAAAWAPVGLLGLGVLLAGWQAGRLLRGIASRAAGLPAPPGAARIAEVEALARDLAAARAAAQAATARADLLTVENRALDAAARNDRRMLTDFVRSVPGPIFVKDNALRYVVANEATAKSLGRDLRDVLGRPAGHLVPAQIAARFEAQDRAVIQSKRIMDFEDLITAPSGRTFCFRTIKAPWRGPSGEILGVVGLARDVTRRRAMEQRLRAAEETMRRIARADSLTLLSAGVAHELNQPLTAASNFLRASLRWLDGPQPAPERLQAARGAIAEAAAETLRAAEILRRMRDFIGRGHTERERLSLVPLLRETVAMAAAARGGAALPVELDLPGEESTDGQDAGCEVLADRVQMQQVFVNLLRNAIEATEGREQRGLALGCRAAEGFARITVADAGPGLPPEVRERLFEPFVSANPEGLGIGLAICRTIVEAHGGRIAAAPRPGGGTVFTLELPLWRDAP
jgi:PAS domain S-box-containing protein